MHNYRLCREFYPVVPGIRPHIRDVRLERIEALDAWRSLWINCLPESPCKAFTVDNVTVGPGTLPPVCEHVEGRGSHALAGGAGCFSGAPTADVVAWEG